MEQAHLINNFCVSFPSEMTLQADSHQSPCVQFSLSLQLQSKFPCKNQSDCALDLNATPLQLEPLPHLNCQNSSCVLLSHDGRASEPDEVDSDTGCVASPETLNQVGCQGFLVRQIKFAF